MPLGHLLVDTTNEYCSCEISFECFLFSDGSLRSSNDRQGDLSKARQFGWTTTVDTFDGYAECFNRLKELHIIP